MKILFIRHGEAMDDVENRFGGWADYPLSSKGLKQAKETARKLIPRKKEFQRVLSSPFKRAYQTAEIIAHELNLPLETSVFLKERNTYGLLCGENKEEAKKRYPELISAYEKDQPVLGYESYESILLRIKELLRCLEKLSSNSIICVAHGKLLKALLTEFAGQNAKDLGENCLIEANLCDGKIKVGETEGVTFS